MPARQAAQHHAHAKKKGAGAQRGVNGALVGHGREFHGEGRRSTPLSARRCDPLSQKRAPREQFAPTWHKSVKNEIQAPSSPPVQAQTPLQTRCLPSYRSCSQTTMYAEPIYDSLHQDIFTEKHALLRSFVLIFFPVLVHTKTALEKFIFYAEVTADATAEEHGLRLQCPGRSPKERCIAPGRPYPPHRGSASSEEELPFTGTERKKKKKR